MNLKTHISPGQFVVVPFTSKGSQVALVVRRSRTGKLVVRPFQAAGRCWQRNLRTIHETEMARVRLASMYECSGLPRVPAAVAGKLS